LILIFRGVLAVIAFAAPATAREDHLLTGFNGPESATHDRRRDAYIVSNMNGRGPANDGYLSRVSPDGLVVAHWIEGGRDGVALHDPMGTEISGNTLYVVDSPDHVRLFDRRRGTPLRSFVVPGAKRLNDLAVAEDGTIYVTDSSPDKGAIYRIARDGAVSVVAKGEALGRPNGIALDAAGNIVTVGLATRDIVTRSPSGSIVSVLHNPGLGNDGLFVLKDGGRLTSSVADGTLAHVRPDDSVHVVATGLPGAASITYDVKRQLVIIPQLRENAVRFFDYSIKTPRSATR
jgi:hypothetical protein